MRFVLFVALQGLGGSLASEKNEYDKAMTLAAADPEGQCVKGLALKILRFGAKPDTAIKSRELNSPRAIDNGGRFGVK